MLNRHTTFYVNKSTPLTFCGKEIGYEITGSSFEPPFEIKPTKGEHDFETCKGCKNSLENITEQLKRKFEGNANKKGFPFCCTQHENLVKIKEFNLTLFANIPQLVAKKVIYTNVHIINNHSSENWYKNVTDYIEWAIESFGQMPANCGEPLYLSDYFFFISEMLKGNANIPKEKKNRIFEYLNSHQKPNKSPKTDFNLLADTYQKWLKIFPFELNSYFGHLKQHFEKQIPILSSKPEINIYSGMAKAKLHTKSSLFEALINLTDNLLTQINAETLYKKGLITNANEIKLQLIINSRKLKLKQGYNSKSTKEGQRYTTMLKEWFKDEKQFITEITPLINSESDIDYMKGEVTFHFYPQGETGYFEVEKNKSKRRYTIEKVFDLELKNWELAIDNAPTKKDKLQAANNAIFRFRKDYLDYTHSAIEPVKEKVIKHLQHIIEYINSSFEDIPIPQQKELLIANREEIQPPDNVEYGIMFNLLGLYRDKHLQSTYIANEMINPPDITTALTYHIPQVLRKHNLTPQVAAELLDRLKTVHKPSIIQNIVLPIITYLRNNESVLTETKSTGNKNNSGEAIKTELFDYSNSKNYFFPNKVDAFKKIEAEFLNKQYVNENGEWQKEKIVLAAFIHILVQLAFVKPKIIGKERAASLQAYRRFFESRYKTDIREQMKPSKFETGKLKNYKPDFNFIPDIDNL